MRKHIKKVIVSIIVIILSLIFRKPILKFTVEILPIKIENLFKSEKTIYQDNNTIYNIKTIPTEKLNFDEAKIKIERICEDALCWINDEKQKLRKKQEEIIIDFNKRMEKNGIYQPMHRGAQIREYKQFVNNVNRRIISLKRESEDVAFKSAEGKNLLNNEIISSRIKNLESIYKNILYEEKERLKKMCNERFGINDGKFEEVFNKIE